MKRRDPHFVSKTRPKQRRVPASTSTSTSITVQSVKGDGSGSSASGVSGADVVYDIKRFDISTVRPYSTILFAGGRRTGKSFCMRDWLFHLRKRFYDAYVWSGSHEEDQPWERFVPAKYVTYVASEFPNEQVQAAVDRQEKRKIIAKQHGVPCPGSAFIYEDLEFLDKSMWKHQSIRQQMLAGRHCKCYTVAAVQYIMQIPLSLRSMIDYAIFTAENNRAVRERIHKQYCGIFRTYSEFESVFLACTTDHGCMVIDCRSNSYNVEDVVFHYKAADHGFFRIGVPHAWDPEVDDRNRQLQIMRTSENPAQALVEAQSKRTKKKGKDVVVGVNLK